MTNKSSMTPLVFHSAEKLPEEWDACLNGRNFFLSSSFLNILEQYPPDSMQFRYVLLKKAGTAVGCLYFQWVPFHAGESISSDGAGHTLMDSIQKKFRNWVADRIRWNTLVLGNLLLTGEHHTHFCDISEEELKNMMPVVFDRVINSLEEEQYNVELILAKDFREKNSWLPGKEEDGAFISFKIRPNMIVPIDASWNDESSYLDAMQSKYRIRMRKARERKEDIICREIQGDRLDRESEKMYDLYCTTADRASFNLFYLHREYFTALKNAFADRVYYEGYYLNGDLVAFSSLIELDRDLVSHFIGYEPGLLKSHDLYLNMLLDMVVKAIERGKNQLILARTATEIKSSVGAVPRQLYNFAWHRNSLTHQALPVLLNYLQPDSVDNIRHPFKQTS